MVWRGFAQQGALSHFGGFVCFGSAVNQEQHGVGSQEMTAGGVVAFGQAGASSGDPYGNYQTFCPGRTGEDENQINQLVRTLYGSGAGGPGGRFSPARMMQSFLQLMTRLSVMMMQVMGLFMNSIRGGINNTMDTCQNAFFWCVGAFGFGSGHSPQGPVGRPVVGGRSPIGIQQNIQQNVIQINNNNVINNVTNNNTINNNTVNNHNNLPERPREPELLPPPNEERELRPIPRQEPELLPPPNEERELLPPL